MAPLRYAPCIVYGSTRFYLPPWLELDETRSQQITVFSPAEADGATITGIRKNQGTEIQVRVRDIPDTPSTADVLYWFEQLWSHLSGRQFKLFIFSDRAWPNCALRSQRNVIGLGPLTMLPEIPLTIFSTANQPDTSLQLDFAGGYANDYPYAHLVGSPSGDAWEPEDLIPVTEPSIANHGGVWPGAASSVTTAGFEHRHVVGGTTGSTWRIKGIQITSAKKVSAVGTTTVRVSTAPVGGMGGSAADASISSTQVFSSETSANIQVTAGDTLYVSLHAAGNHSDVQYKIRLEAE